MKSKKYRSSKFAEKKKKIKRIKRIAWTIFALVLLATVSYWSGHQSLTISQIEITPNQYIDDTELEARILEALESRHLFLFSRKNFLLIPKRQIRNVILQNYRSVAKVTLTVRPDILTVEIEEYQAVAKWCGFDPNEPKDCFLVNSRAEIFAPDSLQADVMRLFGSHESSENIIGQSYIDPLIFEKILIFTSNLPDFEINADYVDTTDEETFTIHTKEGPYLLIERTDDPNEVLNNLKTVIESEGLNGAQFRNLEYIDLRFGNKVYYEIS
jgi:hypothetical protein